MNNEALLLILLVGLGVLVWIVVGESPRFKKMKVVKGGSK